MSLGVILETAANTILLVEDDEDILSALADLLRDEGYRVETAGDGEDALAQLRGGLTPSLILLDLMMPVMNGYEFRREQRADRALAAIPTLVLTASVDARIDEMQVQGWLPKPPDLDALLAAIARWVRPATVQASNEHQEAPRALTSAA
jgi:CheY-like chemotaxis protein